MFAWPEPPSATRGELSADVRDGMEEPAFGGTEFPTGRMLANVAKRLRPSAALPPHVRPIVELLLTSALISLADQRQ